MKQSYDIFRELSEGGPIWIEAVQGLENANSRLLKLCEINPGKYFIFDSVTSKIIGTTPDPSQSRAATKSSGPGAFRFRFRRLQSAH